MYAALVIPVTVGGVVLSAATINGVDRLFPDLQAGLWFGWALLALPPFVLGFGAYCSLARSLRRRFGDSAMTSPHVTRAAPLYVCLAPMATVVGILWAQRLFEFALLVAWPSVAIVGGILGDLAASRSRSDGARAGVVP